MRARAVITILKGGRGREFGSTQFWHIRETNQNPSWEEFKAIHSPGCPRNQKGKDNQNFREFGDPVTRDCKQNRKDTYKVFSEQA